LRFVQKRSDCHSVTEAKNKVRFAQSDRERDKNSNGKRKGKVRYAAVRYGHGRRINSDPLLYSELIITVVWSCQKCAMLSVKKGISLSFCGL